MRIVITESKLNNLILKYIEENFTPTHWGIKFRKEFEKELDNYGMYSFISDGKESFTFFGDYYGEGYSHELQIEDWVIQQLTNMFGNNWYPVFKEWFEKNTGFEVWTIINVDLEKLYEF